MNLPAVQARRGIALVITLIMLSVVTITAVAFLAVSRRERSSVAAAAEQIDARYAADAALNRVKAEITSGIIATTNRFAYGLKVSTNYINPRFDPTKPSAADLPAGSTNAFNQLTNVNYLINPKNGTPFQLPGDNLAYRKMLANLYYDPRPPVFYATNRNPRLPTEFRYTLDLNRNGRIETNGLVIPSDRTGRTNGFFPQSMVGDPEWVGVLENPDAPHSGTNRFLYRYAYLVVPAGRTLDINSIHNSAKNVNASADLSKFSRNEGVGAWEINGAGFLGALNTNIWSANEYLSYDADRTALARGLAFDDANSLVQARRRDAGRIDHPPSTAARYFGQEIGQTVDPSAQARLANGRVDLYSDGPYLKTVADLRKPPTGDDQPASAWSGGDYTNAFTDINQLFDPSLALGTRLMGIDSRPGVTSARSTYDNYTFYRLLGQLGTDSTDARFETGFDRSQTTRLLSSGILSEGAYYRRAKLNLNYRQNDPNGGESVNASVAGFNDWTAINWFTNAAHRLLLTEFTNGLPYLQADVDPDLGLGLAIHGQVAVRSFSADASGRPRSALTNHTYSAQAHRLLQLAANIYDYSNHRTNLPSRSGYPYVPSVFQPVLYRATYLNDLNRFPRFRNRILQPDNLTRLGGFVEVTRADTFLNLPWVDLEDPGFNALFGRGFDLNSIRLSTDRPVVGQNVANVPRARYVGVPLVIGAKKGYPNFNEGFWQSALQVTRRLFVLKTRGSTTPALALTETPFIGGNGKGVATEAQYRFDLRHNVSTELWNSYSNAFPRGVRIVVTNVLSFGLYNVLPNGASNFVQGTNNYIRGTNVLLTAGQWLGGQFRTPLNELLGYSFVYDHVNGRSYGVNETNRGRVNVVVTPPVLNLYVTNRLFYALVDTVNNAILDSVSFKSVVSETNVLRFLELDGRSGTSANLPGIRQAAGTELRMTDFWRTNRLAIGGTAGISNQMAVSLGKATVNANLWRNPFGNIGGTTQDRVKAINGLYYYLYRQFPTDPELQLSDLPSQNAALQRQIASQFAGITNVQVGFNPSPTIYLTDRRQANDPLVHYTSEDLQPGYSLFSDSGNYSELLTSVGRIDSLRGGFQLTTNSVANLAGLPINQKLGLRGVVAYAPWGRDSQLQLRATAGTDTGLNTAYDLAYKDPFISRSDDWAFPTNAQTKLPNIGHLGRVHRGTPWQTVYLKSKVADLGVLVDRVGAKKSWSAWSGSQATHPVNDWKLMDIFTTAVNDNAARGLLSVNQTNIASWSALLSGVPLLTDIKNAADPVPTLLRPDSPELRQILAGYTTPANVFVPGLLQWLNPSNSLAKVAAGFAPTLLAPGGYFTNLGSILSVPTLSDRSPLLNAKVDWAVHTNVIDEVVERIPQQVLSLMKADEPRVVVYSFGQSLKPAPNSLVTTPGRYFGLCTNYQVTGESATRTLLRFDGPPREPRTLVEDHRTLFPSN